jgi:hypothetical protein
LIEGEGFHVFLTGDKNMQNQQKLDGLPRFESTGGLGDGWVVVYVAISREGSGWFPAPAGAVSRFVS